MLDEPESSGAISQVVDDPELMALIAHADDVEEDAVEPVEDAPTPVQVRQAGKYDPSKLFYDNSTGRIESEDGAAITTADGREIFRTNDGSLIDADGQPAELPPVVTDVVAAPVDAPPPVVAAEPAKPATKPAAVAPAWERKWQDLEADKRADLSEDGYNDEQIERKIRLARKEFMFNVSMTTSGHATEDTIRDLGVDPATVAPAFKRDLTEALEQIDPAMHGSEEARTAATFMAAQARLQKGGSREEVAAFVTQMLTPAKAVSAGPRLTPVQSRSAAPTVNASQTGARPRSPSADERAAKDLADFAGGTIQVALDTIRAERTDRRGR